MSDLTDRFAMSMYASRADRDAAMLAEIDRLTAERDALREQLTLAESVRAAQVAGLTEGSEKMRAALDLMRAAIDSDAYAVTFQTIGQYRTALLKAIDAALKGER